tara:strand:+ start:44759 stop:46843 length:2085 start_codon:yes stop_codon:yes gene_type:complete
MAYTINKTDGTILETVEDGTLGTSSTVKFIGRNYQSYGEVFNENLVKLLENSSSANQPTAPVEGELWWDKTNDLLYVYTGTSWIPTGSPRIATTASPPTASIQEGTLWYDTTTNQLKGYNGAGFDVIGPAFTAGANQTGIFIETITKTDDTSKTVASIYVAGIRVAIISDETFEAKTTPSGYGDAVFRPGINIQNSGDSTLFRFDGTATNSDLLDNISSEQFLRSDTNDTTSGTIGIATDSGMTLGADGDLSLTVDTSDIIFANVTLDGDIKFTVNDGGVTKTPITLDGATGSVGIQNTSPSSSFALDVTGSIHATGDLVLDGDLTLGGSSTDTFTIAADIASNIRPDTTLTFDIGSDSKRWRTLFVGNLTLTDNSVATASSNANLKLETNGTGKVDIIDGGLTSTSGDIDIPANIGITFGDDGEKIEGDGTDLTITASNNFTVDAEADIILDANGGDVFVKDNGVTFGSLTNTSGNLIIKSGTTTAATFSGANVTLAGTVGSGAITSTSTIEGTTVKGTTSLQTPKIEFTDGDDAITIVDGGGITVNTSLTLASGATVTAVLDEDNFSSDSATALATQQSIKAYISTQIAAVPNDIYLSLDTKGLDITGSGSGSVVELLNALAPASEFNSGDKAHIASTQQSVTSSSSINKSRVIGVFVISSISTTSTVNNPSRNNDLIYTHTGSSWGYTSGT